MRKTLAVLLTCAFAFGCLAATGCGGPCEKGVDKMVKCLEDIDKDEAKKMKDERKKHIEECKKEKDMEKNLKKCLQESDCTKFIECLK